MDIRTFAGHLGLSITTVSRALAGYPDVGAETRRRVEAEARRLGYRPNPVARRLKTGRAEAVGLALPTGPAGWGDPFYVELLSGVGQALAARDLDLLVSATPFGHDEVAAVRRLVEGKRVDAILLARTRHDDPRVAYLLENNVPFVTHGRTRWAEAHAWLDIDGEAAFAEATGRLLGFGHRRIALVNASLDYAFARHRRAGFERALAEAGLAPDPALVTEGPMTPDSGMERADALAGLADPPTAYLCATDRIALGAMTGLKNRGLAVGRDVSVIGYDDLTFAAHTEPPLTTMRQPIQEEGSRLVELLDGRVAGRPLGELQELWRATLVARGSDGPGPFAKPGNQSEKAA